jgi:cysteate synthase
VNEGIVEKDSLIMLNITGAGEELFKSRYSLYYLEPSLKFGVTPTAEDVREGLATLKW